MIDQEILQKNVAYAENLWRQANSIYLGQLEEAAKIVASKKALLSPIAAASIYSTAFPNASLISEKFAVFLQLLWDKAKDFLQRAFTVIFIATIVIWFLQTFDLRLLFHLPVSLLKQIFKKFVNLLQVKKTVFVSYPYPAARKENCPRLPV